MLLIKLRIVPVLTLSIMSAIRIVIIKVIVIVTVIIKVVIIASKVILACF